MNTDSKQSSVPLSFDFGGEALRPDYVVKCSYGNDSIALLQYLHEYDLRHQLGKVVVLYNNTGWAAKWWEGRVENGEKLARRFGFIPARTECIGFEELVWRHNGFPDHMRRFCTSELKIIPTMNWLRVHDPEGIAEMVCGVRREESAERRNWPEYVDADDKNEGRPNWSPLVDCTEAQRNELIVKAGWVVLPHRSRECRCINANSTDLKTWQEGDIEQIERLERKLSDRNPGKIKLMFHPLRMRTRPQGIRDVIAWAKTVKKKDAPPQSSGCDSGYCTG